MGEFRLRSLVENKKGYDIAYENIIYITLNFIFFALLLYFVYRSTGSVLIYEQTYAKEISLLVDNSKEPMLIMIDFKKGDSIADENKVPLEKRVVVDEKSGKIVVNLAGKGGYSFDYFVNYPVKISYKDDGEVLKINIGEAINSGELDSTELGSEIGGIK